MMSRFLKRLRQGVDNLLASAPPPVSPAMTPLARHHAQLAQIGVARQRLEHTQRALAERRQAMQQYAATLQSEAIQLVARGRHDLAWHSLARRHTALETAEGLATQQTELETHISRVLQIEQQLLANIDAMRQRQEVISARQQTALVQIELGETLTGLNDTSVLPGETSGIDETTVEILQAQAMAMRRLIDDGLIDLPLIDDQFVAPELKSTIDSELATIQHQVSEHARQQRSEP
jgi:phage shock protein A